MKIELVTKEKCNEDILNEIAIALTKCFNAELRLIYIDEDPPRETFSIRRAQYNASKLVTWILKYKVSIDSYIIGLLNYDAYVEGLNFVFGIANPFYKAAIVFTHRLYSVNIALYRERIKKEVFHELGHLLGLKHCENKKCVMRFSNSILDTDHKSWRYCEKCLKALKQSGIYVNEDEVALRD